MKNSKLKTSNGAYIFNGVYKMELKLNHFSEELLVETAEFSIKVLRAMLNQFFGE